MLSRELGARHVPEEDSVPHRFRFPVDPPPPKAALNAASATALTSLPPEADRGSTGAGAAERDAVAPVPANRAAMALARAIASSALMIVVGNV